MGVKKYELLFWQKMAIFLSQARPPKPLLVFVHIIYGRPIGQ